MADPLYPNNECTKPDPASRGLASDFSGLMLGAVLSILLYLLSIGPVVYTLEALKVTKTERRVTTFRLFYAPILFLRNRTSLERAINAYMRLWGVKL